MTGPGGYFDPRQDNRRGRAGYGFNQAMSRAGEMMGGPGDAAMDDQGRDNEDIY